MHSELGYYRDDALANYNLTDEVRDRLIAYARQDAALALMRVTRVIPDVRDLRDSITVVVWMLAGCLALLVLNLFWDWR